MTEPNVDILWYELQPTVHGLQMASRLPGTGDLYDPRLEVVKDHLRRWGVRRSLAGFGFSGIERALSEAAGMSRRNQGASFLAFELIKRYCSLVGDARNEAVAARRAMEELRKTQKAIDKERKRAERQEQRERKQRYDY